MRRLGWLWPALILLIGAGYQFLAYSAVAGGHIGPLRMVLPFLPLLALAWWVVACAAHKSRWLLILLAMALAIYGVEQQPLWGATAVYGIPHAVIYLSLLWLFGQTLRAGKEPLVTRFARRVHGPLPPAMAAYTRRLTIAWSVFFVLQLLASALLFKFSSLSVWSLFINVLNFPLLALMFVGEYAYRIVRHPGFLQASLFDGIRAFANRANDGNEGALAANTAGVKRS